MPDRPSTGREPTNASEHVPRTFAVELVLEVETRAFADRVRTRLLDPETAGVDTEGYRCYVDSAGLEYPVLGASIPVDDRNVATAMYAAILNCEGFETSVRSGTMVIRIYSDEPHVDDAPTVVTASHFSKDSFGWKKRVCTTDL